LVFIFILGIIFLLFLGARILWPKIKTVKNSDSQQDKIVQEFGGICGEDEAYNNKKEESKENKSEEIAIEEEKNSVKTYPIHKNITATLFWVGEKGSDDNDDISNFPSAWDDKWKSHFGGVDSPKKRNGYYPAAFTPKENPFYIALPYNDFDKKGNRKKEIFTLASWTKDRKCADNESYLKNRWVKIEKDGKSAYAQWEDVGPFGENDAAYVFGSEKPDNKENKNAGIDLSPAVYDYLKMNSNEKIDWQFIEFSEVPDGPWKKIITKSQIYWE